MPVNEQREAPPEARESARTNGRLPRVPCALPFVKHERNATRRQDLPRTERQNRGLELLEEPDHRDRGVGWPSKIRPDRVSPVCGPRLILHFQNRVTRGGESSSGHFRCRGTG